MYAEFEVDTYGKNGEIIPMTFIRGNISYYRPFVEDGKDAAKGSIATMVYLVGSLKSIRVKCNYDHFKERINSAE